jgi:2-hydroxychromene-2-carboxylate isomerase
MAVVRVECYFDCASPWGYLGFLNLQKLSTRLDYPVEWKPVVVGFVFSQSNPGVYVNRRVMSPPLKGPNEMRDLDRWADFTGFELNHPPACGHPVNSIKCMRACIALQPAGKMIPFVVAAGEALWRDGRNLRHSEVLADIARGIGVDPDWLLEAIEDPGIKEHLAANNAELAGRGGFGVPTFFVDNENMYWGNNRLPLVEHRMRQALRFAPAPALA